MKIEGQRGQCEAEDWVPVGDDATIVRCTHRGITIREWAGDRPRLRCVCPLHGLTSALSDQ